MTRWLAPLIPMPQHWILHDRDGDLVRDLHFTVRGRDDVTVETRSSDITRLDPDELAGAHLITASALLDMFCVDDLERFITSCVDAGCPALLTLSVTGHVELAPSDPLDERVRAAFNAHQRRTIDGRTLLGPDAAGVAAHMFRAFGADVSVAHSPWHLEPNRGGLLDAWLCGWVGAAVEQEPSLAAYADAYLRTRRAAIGEGRLAATVPHDDLLVIPR
jgi:hypothetical protein